MVISSCDDHLIWQIGTHHILCQIASIVYTIPMCAIPIVQAKQEAAAAPRGRMRPAGTPSAA